MVVTNPPLIVAADPAKYCRVGWATGSVAIPTRTRRGSGCAIWSPLPTHCLFLSPAIAPIAARQNHTRHLASVLPDRLAEREPWIQKH